VTLFADAECMNPVGETMLPVYLDTCVESTAAKRASGYKMFACEDGVLSQVFYDDAACTQPTMRDGAMITARNVNGACESPDGVTSVKMEWTKGCGVSSEMCILGKYQNAGDIMDADEMRCTDCMEIEMFSAGCIGSCPEFKDQCDTNGDSDLTLDELDFDENGDVSPEELDLFYECFDDVFAEMEAEFKVVVQHQIIAGEDPDLDELMPQCMKCIHHIDIKEDVRDEGAVLCPGFMEEEFCDCDGDCTERPDWCGCAEAQECCAAKQEASPRIMSFMIDCADPCDVLISQCGMEDKCYRQNFALMEQNFHINNIAPLTDLEKAAMDDQSLYELMPACLRCVATNYSNAPDAVRGGAEEDETMSRPDNVPQVISYEQNSSEKATCTAYASHRTEPVVNVNRIVISYQVDRGYACPAMPMTAAGVECNADNLLTDFGGRRKRQVKEMRFYDAGLSDNACLCISLCQDPYWYQLPGSAANTVRPVYGWSYHRKDQRCLCLWGGRQRANGAYRLQKNNELITGILSDVQ